MKILDTRKVLTNLLGEPLKEPSGQDLTIGKAIGNILVSSTKRSDPMQMYTLGIKFAQDDKVNLEAHEFKLVKENVEQTETYTILVTGQILLLLEELETVPKEKK